MDELRGKYIDEITEGMSAVFSKTVTEAERLKIERTLDTPRWRDEWWYRYGWNRPEGAPPLVDEDPLRPAAVELDPAPPWRLADRK